MDFDLFGVEARRKGIYECSYFITDVMIVAYLSHHWRINSDEDKVNEAEVVIGPVDERLK